MPTFDAGTYFLTTLAPIRTGSVEDVDGAQISYQQRLRATLATLPTAQQSPATQRIGLQSPFARSLRTHLCRFVVIDDAVYNGRDPRDPILGRLTGSDPLEQDRPDRLNCAYLLFAAEVDAVTEDGAPLPAALTDEQAEAVRDGYARHLWEIAGPELKALYQNCVGFETVTDGDGFADYLKRCQVETTMPFHDYWTAAPKIRGLPIRLMAAAVGAPLIVLALALIGEVLRLEATPVLSLLVRVSPDVALLWSVVLGAFALLWARAKILSHGQKPFPPQPEASLPGVLKALHLQQRFSDFAIAHQTSDPKALHAAFGAFLAAEKPDDLTGPTQPPGVVRTIPAEA
jgi:hypothetical protein